ncbi:MAG: SMI1/KNR4 family protein [Lachnospiraceae bacterium]|nr:SMI1/KNR4 family protein [Lachnospiraceae bacterium]
MVMRDALQKIWDSIPEEQQVMPSAPTEPVISAPSYHPPEALYSNEITIPADLPIREEIEILLYMSEKYPQEVQIEFYEPVNNTTIAMFEERTGVVLPEEVKALYLFSNGLDIGRETLFFEPLALIEQEYNMGYCDWAEEGDANDYLLIGSVIGDGQYLALHKKSGHIFWHDEGDMTDYDTVENLLHWVIEFIYEGYIGKGEDARIDAYLYA